MANNYYDTTGVLVLNKVTPVIKALFTQYHLNEDYPGDGQAYVAYISESTDSSWNSLLENLEELADELEVPLNEHADDPFKECLMALTNHFDATNNEAIKLIIEHEDFEESVSFETLFVLAKAFDDGHGLKAYKVETSWHCSKPRLFEFGGSGDFNGSFFSIATSSSDTVLFGENVEEALEAGDITLASAKVFENLERVLNGVHNTEQRSALATNLLKLISTKISN